MSRPITLIADTPPRVTDPPPEGVRVRACTRWDADQLGAVYFGAYDPGTASESVEKAIADIQGSFDGTYGQFWFQASPVAEYQGEIVAAVLTVRRAPWVDVPACPFIIEVFTAPAHRRRGLARHLMIRCMRTVGSAGGTAVALRVLSDNLPALRLYESLGFRHWTPPAGSDPLDR